MSTPVEAKLSDTAALDAQQQQTLQSLIDDLVKRGIKLQLRDGDVLRFSAPKGALTPELKQELKTHKDALKEFLRNSPTAAEGSQSSAAGEAKAGTQAGAEAAGSTNGNQGSAIGRAFPTADRSGDLPLSHTQSRLWFLDQMSQPGDNAYNMFDVRELRGTLDIAALRQSLDYLTERHESLRTSFHEKDGRPYQKVNNLERSVLGQTIDLSQVPHPQVALDELIDSERRFWFDLSKAPLLRVVLCRMTADRHILIISKHHIISDAWSVETFQRELITAYTAFSAGITPALAPLAVQYGDVAVWQHSVARRAELEDQLAWWKAQLSGAPQGINWPLDYNRPPEQQHAGRQLINELTHDDARRWRELARRFGVTNYMLGLALYAALLSRLSAQDDLVVGSPVANRSRSEFESIIGFFANTLALRIHLGDKPNLPTLLRRVRAVVLAANEHQDTAFERIVEVLQPERRSDQDPIIQTVYTTHVLAKDHKSLSDVSFKTYTPEQQNAKFDCSLTTFEDGDRLVNVWEYRSSLFEAATIESWQARLMQILRNWSADPELGLDHLPLLLDDEKSTLESFSASRLSGCQRSGIIERFAQIVQQHPNAPAVHDGRHNFSYAELLTQAQRWAAWLRAQGIGSDQRVGIVLQRSAQEIGLIFGVLTAGAAYVPLDGSYPAERLQQMCAIADVSLVLGAREACANLDCRFVDLEAALKDVAATQPVAPRCDCGPDKLAYVMFTSGSSGTPKGVEIPHRAVERLCIEPRWIDVKTTDRFAALAPLGFDASTFEIFMPLLNGAQVIVQTQARAGIHELAEFIAAKQITTLWLTSGLFALMIDEAVDKLSKLKYLLAGGDVLSPAHVRRALDALPTTQILNGYGPTENTTFTAVYPVPRVFDGLSALPLGSPISGTSVRILDENMQMQAIGLAGELYAGGDGLARAYAGDARRTAAAFVPDPFANVAGSRLYRSGDRVRWRRDGSLEFLGRIDRQIKISGHRIDPQEIELTLSRHPNVKRTLVAVRGEAAENRRMVVFVESQAGLSQAAILEFAQQHLPRYMIPAEVLVVKQFPLTINGKIDRRSLLANSGAQQSVAEQAAPANSLEAQFCKIFAEVLQRDTFGPMMNFFHLGGHSLLATQLASRLRSRFGVKIPISLVFNAPTPRSMVHALAAELKFQGVPKHTSESDEPPIPAVGGQHSIAPLSAAQSRLWFLAQMPGAGPAYNMPAALELQGALHRNQLRQALDLIVKQHHVLRTRIVLPHGEQLPRQIIDLATPAQFKEIDLRGLPEAEQSSQVARIVREQFCYDFDLAQEHPLHCVLLTLEHKPDDLSVPDPDGKYLFIVNVHHIAGDAWSFNIFVKDLVAFYDGKTEVSTEQLQYADIALWQQAWRSAGGLDRQREYWKNALQGAPTLLDLPTNHEYQSIPTFNGGRVIVKITPELHARWQALGQDLGATPFMTYLAVWGLLLGRHSNTKDVLIAAPIANRNRPEFEAVMGFFVNTLVMRIKQENNWTVRQFLQSVMQTCLEAYSHQDLPLDDLLDLLKPDRMEGRSPLVQVMFDVQNAPMAPLNLGELNISMFESEFDVAKFELSLSMAEDDEGMRATIEYNSDLFEKESVEALGQRFISLLEHLSANPDAGLESIDALTTAERQALLQPQEQLGADACPNAAFSGPLFLESFNDSLHEFSENLAASDGQIQLSYRTLDAYSRMIAASLRSRAIRPGDFVGVALERSALLPAVLLGVLRSGAAFVPLDVNYPDERIALMLNDSQARLVIVDDSTKDAAVWADRQVCNIDGLDFAKTVDLGAVGAADDGDFSGPVIDSVIDPGMAAYVIYTSGSTGIPKGVVITHAAMSSYLVAFQNLSELKTDDRYAQFTALNFDAAIEEMFTPLLAGACLVYPQTADMGDFKSYENFLAASEISVASMTTAFWQEWMASSSSAVDLAQLRRVVIGGEAAQRKSVRQFAERFPGCELFNCYGPTETTISATVDIVDVARQPARGTVPIGRPIGQTRVYLLDSAGRLTPPGCIGEVWISGPQLAPAYLNRPATTAWAFVPDPFSTIPGSRIYRSGDRARLLPDGRLQFVGRDDDQVKIRGFRIELGEIERCLADHKSVERAALVLHAAAGGPQLHAFVELKSEVSQVSEFRHQLRQHIREFLPAHMQPHALTIVELLPRLAGGKIDYAALSKRAMTNTRCTSEGTAPANDLERRILQLWQRTLESVPQDVETNFFDIGGNSLKSIALLTHLQANFPGVFDVADMFDRNTVRLQAEAVNAFGESSDSTSVENKEIKEQFNKKQIGKISL